MDPRIVDEKKSLTDVFDMLESRLFETLEKDELSIRKMRDNWGNNVQIVKSQFADFYDSRAENLWSAEKDAINNAFSIIADLPNGAVTNGTDWAKKQVGTHFGTLRTEFGALCRLISEHAETQPITPEKVRAPDFPSHQELVSNWHQESGFVIATSERAIAHLHKFSEELRDLVRQLEGENDQEARRELDFITTELSSIAVRLGAKRPGYNVNEVEDARNLLDSLKDNPIISSSAAALVCVELGKFLGELSHALRTTLLG